MLGKPVAQMSQILPGRKSAFFQEIPTVVFPLRNMLRRMQKLTAWLRAVDRPAPAIPSLKPKIRMGSPAMFMMAPVIRPIIPRLALPS